MAADATAQGRANTRPFADHHPPFPRARCPGVVVAELTGRVAVALVCRQSAKIGPRIRSRPARLGCGCLAKTLTSDSLRPIAGACDGQASASQRGLRRPPRHRTEEVGGQELRASLVRRRAYNRRRYWALRLGGEAPPCILPSRRKREPVASPLVSQMGGPLSGPPPQSNRHGASVRIEERKGPRLRTPKVVRLSVV